MAYVVSTGPDEKTEQVMMEQRGILRSEEQQRAIFCNNCRHSVRGEDGMRCQKLSSQDPITGDYVMPLCVTARKPLHEKRPQTTGPGGVSNHYRSAREYCGLLAIHWEAREGE